MPRDDHSAALEGFLHVGHGHGLPERMTQRLDNVERYARRRERRHPLRGANAGEADLREGGDVRMLQKPPLGRDGERAHAACLHHPNGIGDVEPRHMDVAIGEIADDLGAAAFEGNVHELEAGAPGEDLGVDLLIAADPGAPVAHFAGMLPGIG